MTETLLSEDEERKLMKWGLEIEAMYDGAHQYGDILLSDGPGGRDVQLKSGVPNLGQQLTSAIATALGTDPLNLSYGFAGLQALSEETSPLMRREKLRFALVEVLQADPRVRQITRILIGEEIAVFYTGNAGGTSISASATTPGSDQRALKVEAQFTIHSGENVTLALAPMSGGLQ